MKARNEVISALTKEQEDAKIASLDFIEEKLLTELIEGGQVQVNPAKEITDFQMLTEEQTPKVVVMILEALKESGYTVEVSEDNNSLTIS